MIKGWSIARSSISGYALWGLLLTGGCGAAASVASQPPEEAAAMATPPAGTSCTCVCVDSQGCGTGDEFSGKPNGSGSCNYSANVDATTCSTKNMTCATDSATLWSVVLDCDQTTATAK